MRKAIATRTILLVLIGVIIVGLMVYLIVIASRKTTTPVLSLFECKAKLMEICRYCENVDWDAGYDVPQDVINECSGYVELFYWAGEDDCDDVEDDCKILMGTS